MFGHIPGIEVGAILEDRQALREAGLHRPTQAGICGRADEGAESVVLNGGYVDDEDFGDVVIYTGVCRKSWGFRVFPHWYTANSVVTVLPNNTAPSSRIFATQAASADGWFPAKISEPYDFSRGLHVF